jgi:LysM repeat protein
VRSNAEVYVVQPGDSLNEIAVRYGVGVGSILAANNLLNPDILGVGQILYVPVPEPLAAGPSDKLIPDSELVDGPSSVFFNLPETIEVAGGALARYTEVVDGETLTGAEILDLVAHRYSVNPRILLALLEWSGGWMTEPAVPPGQQLDPLGINDPIHEGLFSQLSWAADALNSGFYLWRAGWSGPYLFPDGRIAQAGPGINAGTAGIQLLFSRILTWESWHTTVSQAGFIQTYKDLFGDPFDWAIEPLIPDDLSQPDLQLPFEDGDVWSFTSGPHGAWGTGSAWAALDFAPPGFALGCVRSEEWITAVGEGPVVRSDTGVVVQDLDGDGEESVGWAVVYLHVEARERVLDGSWLLPGDRIGHPSCEGGISNGTHLHLARKFNGVWLEADGQRPFVMDDWVSAGTGREYDGVLTRGDQVLEACSCRNEFNQIWR